MFKRIFKDGFKDFSKGQKGGGFMDSNSIIAKFAFLVLVLICFLILLRLGTSFLGWLFQPSGEPILVDGLKQGNESLVIKQNPNERDSIPLLRSNNEDGGIEFTWSVWLEIKGLPPNKQDYSHVFHKGNNRTALGQLNTPNNAPGLYIDNRGMTRDNGQIGLKIVMNTFNNIEETVHVNDVPFKKWFNVMIRVRNENLDVYVNGSIVNRHVLQGVPKQNYSNVYVCEQGGFMGQLSDLRYFNSALGTTKIQSIVMKGPNLKIANGEDDVAPPYLGLRWYLFN